MQTNILSKLLLVGLCASAATAVSAQNELPAGQSGVVFFGGQTYGLESCEAVEMEIPTHAVYSYAVSGESWIHPAIQNGKLVISVDENPEYAARTAQLTVRTAAGGTGTIHVSQPGRDIVSAAQGAINATRCIPVWTKDAAKKSNGKANTANEGIEKTIDGDMSTMYHSAYSGFSSSAEDQWPTLEYYFTAKDAPAEESVTVASIDYCPRTSGSNGNFGLVDIQIGRYDAEHTMVWTSIQEQLFDFAYSGSATTVAIPEEQQAGIHAIRFIVHTGYAADSSKGNFASCAEMVFNRPAAAIDGAELFTDNVFSALKPGTTAEQVAAITNPLLKQLAEEMLAGTYTSAGRVSTHEPIRDVRTLAEDWNAPGKCYSQFAGVTGVALTPGTYVIIADGIAEHKGNVELKLAYWHGHDQYDVYDDEGNKSTKSWNVGSGLLSYALKNGINVITIPQPWRPNTRVKGDDMALCYINNYDDEGLANGTGSDITVHIVGGLVNGYLSNTKTNAENAEVLNNAVYPCMDMIGSRTQGVWQTEALKKYAAGEWVRLINIYDELIIWEHRVLGIDKYNRVPANRTLAYVNYNYYMYQGGFGPTFMYNTQNRVCSPDNLVNKDCDAVWGLSHEWGHQHQMAPYFRWVGTAEVTNNLFSAYNVRHMGYTGGRYPSGKWDPNGHIHHVFIDDAYNRQITDPDKESGETKTANANDNIVMSLRSDAAKAAKAGRAFGWCDELKQFAQDQPKYPSKRFESDVKTYHADQEIVNPLTALNAIEAYSSNNGELILAPWLYTMYWFSEPQEERPAGDERPDLWPDLFEAMRQNDGPQGSTVEKNDGVDKYELLASIFNGNKSTDPSINKAEQFIEQYPASVWTTHNYFKTDGSHSWQQNSGPYIMNCIRKLSRLTGYNLFDFFEPFGCITVCALEQGDYGTQYYIMTQEMYDEFKADMQALEDNGTLKPLTEDMRLKMTYVKAPVFPAPSFPNDRPILPTDN